MAGEQAVLIGIAGTEPKPKGWNCNQFKLQTASFVQGRNGELVRFGYIGQHTEDFKNDIAISDVQWLLKYLGRVSDAQIRSGLKASGASPNEVACFTVQLRARINQLRAVVKTRN